MASASSLAHFNMSDSGDKVLQTIEIDPQYAQGLGFAEGDVVEIGLLHDMSIATHVETEPLSSDDWEIIEIHASHVESTLLSQVRVANIGQEINVWVLGRTRVRLRVVSLQPSNKGGALLLAQDTEVSIAPKLRKGALGSSGASALKQSTTISHTSQTTVSAESQINYKPRVLRVLPPRLLPASALPFYQPPTDTSTDPLAFVHLQVFVQLAQIPYPWLPAEKDALRGTVYKASIRKLQTPVDPSQIKQDSSAPAQPPAPPVPRVLNPGAPAATAEKSVMEEKKNEVWLAWSEEVLQEQVVFPALVENIQEWDLVGLTVTGEREVASKLFPSYESSEVNGLMSRATRSSVDTLAGVDDILERCTSFVIDNFMIHRSANFIRGTPGLLLTGQPGTGKTSIMKFVGKMLQEDRRTYTYVLYADFSKYTGQPVSLFKTLFKYWHDKAMFHRPSVLIFDNIDGLISAEVEQQDSFRSRHIAQLFVSVFSAGSRFAQPNSWGIVLLATARSKHALHAQLNNMHIFGETVDLKPPDKDARKKILSHIVQRHLDQAPDIKEDPYEALNYAAISTETEGYSASDLRDLVARAIQNATIRAVKLDSDNHPEPVLLADDFEKARKDLIPLSLRDVKLEKSDVRWADIGGLAETKRVLRETLEWPTKYGPIFKQSPLRLRSGLLLYGYPGCGKTLLASAVAKECGLNFISVKGPEILNKYIGASEQSVRDLFERASAAKPCVLFFDEFDAIAPKRGHDSTGVTDRVVNQMLTQMDGAEGLEGVYVLAATSRPDLIDSALLRPGRLDKSLLCNMPDEAERKNILQALSKNVALSQSVDLEEIAARTNGFSGADLQALLYNAHLEAVHASLTHAHVNGTGKSDDNEPPVEYTVLRPPGSGAKSILSKAEQTALQRRLRQIQKSAEGKNNSIQKAAALNVPKTYEITDAYIRKVMKTTRPSVPFEERTRLERIYNAFLSDRSGGMPTPPDPSGVGNRATLM